MNILALVIVASVLALPFVRLIYEAKRLADLQRCIRWQDEKWQKIKEGWRPTLWDEGASDEEKADAIMRYARGEQLEQKVSEE